MAASPPLPDRRPATELWYRLLAETQSQASGDSPPVENPATDRPVLPPQTPVSFDDDHPRGRSR